jgi:three-Cys-motif partner protein
MSSDKYDWQIGAAPPLLEEHSAAKHAVFRSYIRRYIEVLTSDPRHDALNLTLVDGFAGGGEYAHPGGIRPGSPVILLEKVARAQAKFDAERTKPFALKAEFIFVEEKESSLEYLRRKIQSTSYRNHIDDSIHLIHASFRDALPSILNRIRGRGRAHRSIFILDQSGYGDISFRDVRRILTTLENPEIILTFNVDYLIDF